MTGVFDAANTYKNINRYKKAAAVLLSLFLLLFLNSCRGKNEITVPPPSSTAAITTEKEDLKADEIILGFYKDGEPKKIESYELKSLLEYSEITSLTVANYKGEDLSLISKIGGLRSLKLMNMERVTDIYFLKDLPMLETLMICNLSDDFRDLTPLSYLKNLRVLGINNICVEDLSPVFALKNLKKLDLTSSAITAEQYEMLRSALPGCEITNVVLIVN